jgi:hypothetical protein
MNTTIKLPESPITVWDNMIMADYPFIYQLTRVGIYNDAVKFARENFNKSSYAWKGTKFFFKNEKDAIWFALRWT